MATETVVLVAIDNSQQAEDAFKYYLDTLYKTSHNLILVHIVELPSTFDEARHENMSRGTMLELWHEEEEKSKPVFDKYKSWASDKGASVADCVLEKGLKPGHVISEIAKEKQAGLIIMGTRGLGTIRRTIMGSVSNYVLHHAHCPVVIYRK